MASQSKRPWLAALLATLVTGLGHFYLRRWTRGLGWFAAAVAVSALFVPPEAARALLSGSEGDVADVAPLLAVGVASVADAYVLARMRQRGTRNRERGPRGRADTEPSAEFESEPETGPGDGAGRTTVGRASGSAGAECPECGEELDPDLDFCPWCTARLDESGEE
ncbi:zinc ribbon domain-containing protein [Halobellus salinus]|uniref:Zinc ribbon domain-containing protein n=1 Tax=Halobellus salinus TaxID=931585 RepID=A0A830E6F2_9EURY|nr:zinc ribbon domain-containing protein [Halobellus salinus]GGI93951.1 zinc ribbon domain-containing protein [Halobellus salinus]SMP19233.1 hypothetical protein SAMN06265347_10718 [Halobellus salinus]